MNELQQNILDFNNYYNNIGESLIKLQKKYPYSEDLRRFIGDYNTLSARITKMVNKMNSLNQKARDSSEINSTMSSLAKTSFYLNEFKIMVALAKTLTLYDYITKDVLNLKTLKSNLTNSFSDLINRVKINHPVTADIYFNQKNGTVEIKDYTPILKPVTDNNVVDNEPFEPFSGTIGLSNTIVRNADKPLRIVIPKNTTEEYMWDDYGLGDGDEQFDGAQLFEEVTQLEPEPIKMETTDEDLEFRIDLLERENRELSEQLKKEQDLRKTEEDKFKELEAEYNANNEDLKLLRRKLQRRNRPTPYLKTPALPPPKAP